MALNDRQSRFCEEYLIDLTATQAASRSGYSKKTAGQIGERLLKNVEIQARVRQSKEARSQRTEITADFVLTGLKEVAERCLQRVPVIEWNYEAKAFQQKTDGEGNGIWEFDSSGANRAFELLGKHVGVFEKDNSQKKPESPPMNDQQVDKLIDALKKRK